MKLKILLLMLFVQVSGHSFSQVVTLTGHQLLLQQVFEVIKAQTGYLFLYDPAVLQKAKPIDPDLRQTPLRTALEICFKGQPVIYKIMAHTILVAEREAPSTDGLRAKQPIPGKVLDSVTAEPLANVSVQVATEKNGQWAFGGGTLTDNRGMFSLRLRDRNAFLFVSCSGFEPQTVTAGSVMGSYLIRLKRSTGNLPAAIVNKGYYTTTQELNTGDVSTVTAKTIALQPVSDPLLALQGRVAGLIVTQQSGIPGSAITVQCRGRNSITSGNDPFYVIDGVPFTSTLLLTTDNQIISGGTTGGSSFSFLNASDIESISVLKDADALAIYGSQGANGAILITTKKGKAGPIKTEINMTQGVGTDPGRLRLLNTTQYLQMRHEALKNDGLTPALTDYDLLSFDPHRYTDWQKALTGGSSGYTNAYISLSGGSRTTTFLVSGTYFRQGTVFPGDFNDQKKALHFSGAHKSADGKLNALLSVEYLADDNRLPQSDLTPSSLNLPPNAPGLYNADGSLHWENGFYNPLTLAKQPFENKTNNLIGNAVVSYPLLRGLKLTTSFGLVRLYSDQTVLTPLSSQDPSFQPVGSSSVITNKVDSWIIEPGMDYSVIAGPGKLSATVGATLRQNLARGYGIAGMGYTSDSLLGDLQAASLVYTSLDTYAKYRYEALYGQVNYSYKDKYVVNLTGRRDGSSRFGPGHQFADFGAVGAAWIFSKEPWVEENLPFLNFGKLRGSYGSTGNDQIGDYGFLSLWTTNFYPYLGSSGYNPTSLNNPNFAWEVNRKAEGSVEGGLWQDRVHFSVSCYYNRSTNQILGQPLTSTTGFVNITANLPATVQNSGLECELNTVNLRWHGFRWVTSFNLTAPRNRLVRYPGLDSSINAESYVTGWPLSIEKLFNYRGVDPATGLYQFLDASGKLTSAPVNGTDQTEVRQVGLRAYAGLANTFTWKGFSLDILFVLVQQTADYLPFLAYFNLPGLPANQTTDVLARWQHPGEISTVQKYSTGADADNAYYYAIYSTKRIVNADYIRLKNCSFSYSLPAAAVRRLHAGSCRLYAQGQNLFTITRYKGLDPESLTTSLPPLRVVTGGIQLTL